MAATGKKQPPYPICLFSRANLVFERVFFLIVQFDFFVSAHSAVTKFIFMHLLMWAGKFIFLILPFVLHFFSCAQPFWYLCFLLQNFNQEMELQSENAPLQKKQKTITRTSTKPPPSLRATPAAGKTQRSLFFLRGSDRPEHPARDAKNKR